MDSPKNILVCVTQQKTCERLIKKAAGLRNTPGSALFVIHVTRNDLNFLDTIQEGEALQYLFNVSKAVGASLSVLKSDDITGAIADYALENRISCIVMGDSPGNLKENAIYNGLKEYFMDMEIIVVPNE